MPRLTIKSQKLDITQKRNVRNQLQTKIKLEDF